jgi:capsule polysaccharide modification protein KpsS
MWLNKLGGYDSYIFSKASRKSYTTEKKSFNQRNYNIVEGNYSLYNGRFVNDNAITYNSSFKEKWNLNTDIIDESTYSWLAELITSPQVFYYDNGYYYPIQITDTNYEFKKWINDRAFNLNLNIEFGDTFNTQYR